jgi:hypothetical protein
MMKFTRFFVALFLLCFALSANAATKKSEYCTPYDLVGQWLFDYGLIPPRAFPKIKLLDSQALGKTTGKGTEVDYNKGWEVVQYTHLITFPPAKKGGAPVKVIVITECAAAANTMDASPLVYLISPVYMRFNIIGDDDASMLNSKNVARKELQEKIKEIDKKADELGKEE